jgi:hypothetical protein
MIDLNEGERAVTYRHGRHERYRVIAAPAGTRSDELRGLGLEDDESEFIANCIREGQPMIAITDPKRSDCFEPVTFPEVIRLLSVSKEAGTATEVVIRRSGARTEIAALR